MKFGNFFSVTVTHEFLDGAPCRQLLINPTPACAALLKKYGLAVNNSQYGQVSVLARQAEDGSPLVKVEKQLEFDFFVSVAEKDFILYTKLPPKKANEAYLFSNRNLDRNQPLKITPDVIQKPKTTVNEPLFGILKISKDSSFPTNYTLHFEANAVRWRYYLIANTSVPNLIVDGKLSNLTFSKTNPDNLTSTDSIAKAILHHNPGATLSVFESDKAVPYRQTGRKNIQLINGNNNTVLINHLPNPDFTDNGIKIIKATA